MLENKFLKVFCSLPILLLVLYFIPFLGICLLFFRGFLYSTRKQKTFLFLILCGCLLVIPQLIHSFFSFLPIPYVVTIVSAPIYKDLFHYGKFLITLGGIFFLLSALFRKVSSRFYSHVGNYIRQDLQKEYEIRKENDLKIQEKREKAGNTHVVRCPYCGSDTMLTEQTATCTFCRRKIEYKKEVGEVVK